MPQRFDLSDLVLAEVSLVGKAANGKQFLIYKSLVDPHMPHNQPSSNDPQLHSTVPGIGPDLSSLISTEVSKAVSGLTAENDQLRQEVQLEKSHRRLRDLEDIAKSSFSELGVSKDIAQTLLALEDSNLPSEVKKAVLDHLKQANSLKKEAVKLLKSEYGSSRSPGPGTPEAEFDSLVSKRVEDLRKSRSGPTNSRVLKSQAMTEVSLERPDLRQAVLASQRIDASKGGS